MAISRLLRDDSCENQRPRNRKTGLIALESVKTGDSRVVVINHLGKIDPIGTRTRANEGLFRRRESMGRGNDFGRRLKRD